MVAYSFQKRFCEDVASGRKTQTIRADRKRHARVGEPIQLYFGMRAKYCRKLVDPDPVCTAIVPIVIWVPLKLKCHVNLNGGRWKCVDSDFARADGFQDAEDFTRFWRDVHGPGDFHGVLIRWTIKTDPPRDMRDGGEGC